MSTDPFERAVDAERQRRDARRRAAELMGFRVHLAAYVGVQILLVTIWALTGAGYQWFWYPLVGWGIGIAVHAAVVFRSPNRTTTSPSRPSNQVNP